MGDIRGWDPEEMVERHHAKATTDDIISKSLPDDTTSCRDATLSDLTADKLWDQIGQVYATVRPSRHGFNRLEVLQDLVENDGVGSVETIAAEYETNPQSVDHWLTQFADMNLIDTAGTPTRYGEIVIEEVQRFGAELYDSSTFEQLLSDAIYESVPEQLAATIDADATVAQAIAAEVEECVDVHSPETNPLDEHVPYETVAEYLDAINGDRLQPFLLFAYNPSLDRDAVADRVDESEYTVENWIREYRETGLMETSRGNYAPTTVGDHVVEMAETHYERFQQAAVQRRHELEQELENDSFITAVTE